MKLLQSIQHTKQLLLLLLTTGALTALISTTVPILVHTYRSRHIEQNTVDANLRTDFDDLVYTGTQLNHMAAYEDQLAAKWQHTTVHHIQHLPPSAWVGSVTFLL